MYHYYVNKKNPKYFYREGALIHPENRALQQEDIC